MNKIIFLDIDGVLNSINTFKSNYHLKKYYNKILEPIDDNQVKILLLDIELNKVNLLKEIINYTGAKIVVTSSWRYLKLYPLIEEYLIKIGLPIIDKTNFINSDRGKEIKEYLCNHCVGKFIILDDDLLENYDYFKKYLIQTNYYLDGLEKSHVEEAKRMLGLNKI